MICSYGKKLEIQINMETCTKMEVTLLYDGRLLTFIFFILAIATTPAQGTNSTCEAPPALSGSETTVTCVFLENITKSKVNVYINHYIKDILNNEIVLVCKSPDGNFNCSGIPGYQFVKYERDFTKDAYKLITQISEVNQSHTGKYCCEVSWLGDNQENGCHECTLELIRVLPKDLESSGNHAVNGSTENEVDSFIFPLTVTLAIILPLLIIATVIIVIFLCVRRQRRRTTMDADNVKSPNAAANESLLTTDDEITSKDQTDQANKKLTKFSIQCFP